MNLLSSTIIEGSVASSSDDLSEIPPRISQKSNVN
jgi:hypothetical protein